VSVGKRVFLYIALALIVASISFILRTETLLFPMLETWIRVSTIAFIVAMMLLARSLLVILTGQLKTKEVQYVITRIGNLAIYAIGLFAFLSIMMESWLPLALSLGLVGFALTFVLQAPLGSIIGWMYIMLKPLYSLGDVVEIGDERGIVRDIGYMATQIEEIGEEIAIVRPTGRIANIPNSMVLQVPVHNYGSEQTHSVWDSVSFTLSYESDLKIAGEVMLRVAEESAKKMFDGDMKEKPVFKFTPSQSWIEASIRYPVKIGSGTAVRNEVTMRILEEFNKRPEIVKFPVGRSR